MSITETRPGAAPPAAVPTADFDISLALLRSGYPLFGRRFEALGSDVFRTRLMLRPVTVMRGLAAARHFYDRDRFTRVDAAPATALRLLQDEGSVQQLDGALHRGRKRLFMALAEPSALDRLAAIAETELERAFVAAGSPRRQAVRDGVGEALTRTALLFAGLPEAVARDPAVTEARHAEFRAMVTGAGSFGPRNWRAQLLRRRSERWAGGMLAAVRSGRLAPEPETMLARIATHLDEGGRPLSPEAAAVELLNVLRPIYAVTNFIVFAVLEMLRLPEWRDRIAAGDGPALEAFVAEVRRHAPFFPFVGGRARAPHDFGAARFEAGDWVILDLFGTNRHPRAWRDPDRFEPGRFLADPAAFDAVVAQGAGSHREGHRCPGEAATIALIAVALRFFAHAISYRVPPQDLTVDLAKVPAQPKSGLVIEEARRRTGS